LIVGVALWPRHAPAPLPAPAQDAELLVKHRAPTTPQQRLRARLMIPVEGVTRTDLQDTWGDARSEGRTHQGIDIMAAQGTRVQAVADGRIVKFFDSVRGGVTIYQFDQTERFVYYYGHLSARAAGLAEGDQVRQGATIGYVGMTGNAPVPHLHFEIQRLRGTERRWWQADSMNPYSYLMTGAPPA
jgi:murein DD-endopeptidase MepM/ murein hydrolase activator NlpD